MTISAAALLSRVEETIRREKLFRPGDTIVVALSGGADSTALLDLLSRLPGYNLRLVAAHLNHCLRGCESDADEEFCRHLALRYGVLFETRRVDVGRIAEEERLNIEDAGRRARIAFLDEIRDRYGAAAVALAHHADDQAETVLMRLLRGSGMTGLSGMAYRNGRGYVRPLLDIPRPDIEQYLRLGNLEWREDASNSDTVYLRNRIRHQLLPLLEEYNPAIRSCLAETASIIADDDALLQELTVRAVARSCTTEEGRVVCSIPRLRTLESALLRRVLRQAVKQLAGTLEGIGMRHIEALCDLIHSDRPNATLILPHGIAPVREYDRLVLMRANAGGADSDFELLIPAPGSYPIPGGGALIVAALDDGHISPDQDHLCLDSAVVPFPWLVRTYRPGDRMTPLGMTGRKKVKDIFIDRKIPLRERRRIPLLWCGDDLLWIAGVCVSELCRIQAPSAAAVRVTWRRA